MHCFARLRKRIVAIATVAILINALAPAISTAATRFVGQRTPWLEVCTTEGLLRVDSNKTTKQKHGSLAGDHKCPCCSTHAGTFLHATSPRLVVASTGRCVIPQYISQAPVGRNLLADHSARAPPQHS